MPTIKQFCFIKLPANALCVKRFLNVTKTPFEKSNFASCLKAHGDGFSTTRLQQCRGGEQGGQATPHTKKPPESLPGVMGRYASVAEFRSGRR
ncbi:hypothetical protein J2792_003024 [Novosphingobium capsulatum]|uniref:Uncharacterized protein n=1 Tax=Novosphingobium capsulatum TaxID=13688 RepID=A0ABU1MP79_9SPHN|nr:hypothetical protein [Novosphingobium capsulatum]MDR6512141.1 hypothetical protein [Novosphingobium capsulatum]